MKRNRWLNWSAFGFLAIAVIFLAPGMLWAAEGTEINPATGDKWRGAAFLSAALAVGIGCLASSFAVARLGSAGLGALSEKPELAGKALVFLGLAEGIAIYGLIIAIMIINKL